MKLRKNLWLIAILIFIIVLSGVVYVFTRPQKDSAITNHNVVQNSSSKQSGKRKVAKDGAVMQTSNKNIATRVIKNGTKINIVVGDKKIPATLNDSKSSKQLISMLPYTVKVSRYTHDYCGVMNDPLRYDEKDVHYGWLNGDIDFARDANYFTILFKDEDESEQFGDQINLGKVDGDLSQISSLDSEVDMKIELAK
ncbi:cyclophilin-like fold protein [Leuconostoc sp. DB-1]|uniref:cyclophilin-like fold protein n=1 Tax=Leuconostoc sp. DB-1 TaxID=2724526 RepID=UPI001C54D543|nr:cyclophilin-like fold protein [Leuconostoc sp. DB-1]